MKTFIQHKLSLISIYLIATIWISIIAVTSPWKHDLTQSDAGCYYSYLPATFIYHDLTLNFLKKKPEFIQSKYPPIKAPNGAKVIKTTMGLSFLYFPFFLIGHIAAILTGTEQDGFSIPYQFSLLTGVLIYLIIGFIFLRKILLYFFSDFITSLTILSVFLGTNLLWYCVGEPLYAHSYLFSLMIIFMWLAMKWFERTTFLNSVLFGLCAGLATLIRPTLILWLLLPFFYWISKSGPLKNMFLFLSKRLKYISVILVSFIIIGLPQLFYWKYITGQWFFFSYAGERFFLDRPHLIEGLFGFRKGWFLYTPLMFFAVIGLFFTKKNAREFNLSILIPFLISTYLIFCWWAWWYGGSFGLRAMVDFYGILSIPLAAFYNYIFSTKNKTLIIILCGITGSIIYLNLFQTWQMSKGLIHYDSMTKKSYLTGFGQIKNTAEWWESLTPPNYDRALLGMKENYTLEEIKNIKPGDYIHLQSPSIKFLTAELMNDNEVTAYRTKSGPWEEFHIIYLSANDEIAIRAYNKKFLSVDWERDNCIMATENKIGPTEKFKLIYLDGIYFALKAWNGKYLSIEKENSHLIKANATEIGEKEKFRILIN